MSRPLVVVTGKNGQLGSELFHLASSINGYEFLFVGRDELDLAEPASIPIFFQKHKPAFFINCAAYTAVDKAEKEQELAYRINATSVGIIAKLCKENGTVLIHVSTDYVFNGNGTKPYLPDDETDPVNYYGHSKWMGEKLALENCDRTIIIRTSWVYSEHGNNFVKTMLRLMKERTDLNVVSDQIGSPTYAKDLAQAIIEIIAFSFQPSALSYGIFHFSNTGVTSWYEFADAIKTFATLGCSVHPIPTSAYPTPAKRPSYSVMDTQKIVDVFHVQLRDWKDSLQECLRKVNRSVSQ